MEETKLNVAGLEEGCMIAGHSTEFQCGQSHIDGFHMSFMTCGVIEKFLSSSGVGTI
jgi:hypothetical protein